MWLSKMYAGSWNATRNFGWRHGRLGSLDLIDSRLQYPRLSTMGSWLRDWHVNLPCTVTSAALGAPHDRPCWKPCKISRISRPSESVASARHNVGKVNGHICDVAVEAEEGRINKPPPGFHACRPSFKTDFISLQDHRFYYAQVAPKDYRKAHNQIDILIQFTTSLKMSFLYQTTPVLRTAVRSSIVRSSPRLFSTTVIQQKSATESVKDGLKTSTEQFQMSRLPASTKESN
ncbi:hypothetical protein CLAIMM_09284 [Cladophialophora immunda]|nr:hypothetical protein CLAIMM_09284 [Cladophialophora immunda]